MFPLVTNGTCYGQVFLKAIESKMSINFKKLTILQAAGVSEGKILCGAMFKE